MTVFLRLLETPGDDKSTALLRAVTTLRSFSKREAFPSGFVFERRPEVFSTVPRSPYCYWVSDLTFDVFRRLRRFDSHYLAASGTGTLDDSRFLRQWFETHLAADSRWIPFAKGGAFSQYYFDHYLSINWADQGAELKSWITTRYGGGHWARNVRSTEYYFRPGLTWPRRTNGLSFRAMPAGSIFGDKGPAAFVEGDSPDELLALSAILNSSSFGYLMSVQLARTELAQSYEVGLIQQTPVPDRSTESTATLASLARRTWSLKRSLDTTNETSHAFILPPGLNEKVTGLKRDAVERELASIEKQIDDETFRLYGISTEDRAAIEAFAQRGADDPDSEAEASGSDDEEEERAGEKAVQGGAPAETVLSWLVGVAFGRFDPRLATGERP
ncbi:MAG TPA: hypothetical protein PLN93_06410, partial [Vicinamibacterales bacterium]|nr:hypothetical protein [Vicinamibacterales bacterium]